MTGKQLKELFEKYGDVKFVDIVDELKTMGIKVGDVYA